MFLLVGLFVVFKQGGRTPFVIHFATFCLAAFVFAFYTPIGSYRDLDLAIAFLRSAALILFAPLFVHFSAIYPVRYRLVEERRWRTVLLYVPAVVLLIVATVVFFGGELSRVRQQPAVRVPGHRDVEELRVIRRSLDFPHPASSAARAGCCYSSPGMSGATPGGSRWQSFLSYCSTQVVIWLARRLVAR